MKITIKQLRQIVQETVQELSEAQDKDLAIGDVVSVLINNRVMKGKIVDRFASKFVDPMAAGKMMMPKKSGRMMWAVEVAGKIYHLPAEEIDIIRSRRDKILGNPAVRAAWKTDMNVKNTQEAVAVSGMSTMIKGHDQEEDPTDKKPVVRGKTDKLLTDDDLTEVDETKEGDVWNDRRYDTIARQLVNNWEDKDPDANWKAIAKSYCKAKQAQTGKTINPDALYAAIVRYIETDGDSRNQSIMGGTHQYK